jgi:hypothetical protein
MSNPINIISDSIDKINNNLDLIESKEQSVDNVKDQICNICSYNERLNQSYNILYYATIVQLELAPVLAATKSLTEILKHFCNACADYENNKQTVITKLSPYISQLRESLSTIQGLINKNKEYINTAYKYIPNLTKQPQVTAYSPIPETASAAGGYKKIKSRRRQNKSRRRQNKSRSKRKSIKKKSKKNRRR